MPAPEYSLPLSDPATLARARRWLLLGALALGIAGIFAGLLGSTNSSYFYTALVVHVDLSVLVWFLTMACMFFTLAGQRQGWGLLADAAFISFAGGAALVALSAFTGGEPYMSNYIPVIHHPVFFMGLSLLFCGVLGVAANLIFACVARKGVQQFGVVSAAFILLIAFVCFAWSQHSLPAEVNGQAYYEYAFWGGGHVLQFVHVQLMMVAWLWLAEAAGFTVRLAGKGVMALYAVNLLAAVSGLIPYFMHDPASDEFRNLFTLLMKHANGLAPLVLGGFILLSLRGAIGDEAIQPSNMADGAAGLPREQSSLAMTTLLMSMLLFAAGGALGYLIAGSNVTVPAHYHGSIVGVTLAFMGVCYLLLPAFGWADVRASKLAFWQPVIYGGGQLCWMMGMAILGAHGVPRKTPGSADTVGALAAFLKHGGDGLALIGGLLFVFIVLRAVWEKERL